MAETDGFGPRDLVDKLFAGGVGLVRWLSGRWWRVPAPPMALAALLGYGLPRALRGAGAPQAARLVRESGVLALGWAGADLALMAALPRLRLSYAPVPSAFLYLLGGRAAISGAGTALALARALRGADLRPREGRALARLLGVAHVAMTAFVVYATYVEGQRLQVTRDALAFPGRAQGAAPARLRLAHLSDIHIARLSRRDEAMLADLRAARPDLICLTGDFLDSDYRDARAYGDLYHLMRAVVALQPRYGVFACLGNNDPPDATHAVMRRAGVHVLDDTAVTLRVAGRRVQILGARTGGAADWVADLPRFREAAADAVAEGPADLHILLYHTPDLAPQAAAAGVDLYLCGHTHGGQIRLPFLGALRTASRFGQRYAMGLHRLPNGGYLHTSRGLGFEGQGIPRMRVLCPPQVALFDVTMS